MNNEEVIKAVEQRVRAAIRTLPRLVGNEAVNFSKDSFRRQGWLGDSFQPWPARKAGGKWGKTPRNKGRAILIDTGKMRRATRVISADLQEIKIGNDVPYAQAHNDGVSLRSVTQHVKAHRRKRKQNNVSGARGKKIASGITFVKSHERKIRVKIPRRRFIGNSPYLNRNISRLIASQINKAINQ